MANYRFPNHPAICVFIVLTGLGLAFVMPALASSQGLSANSQVSEPLKASRATRYYVAKTGSGTNPTVDWSGAFNNLQDALAAAKSGDEIWVASGIYTPGETISDSFKLVPGVALYGGFDTSDTQFSERDWKTNVTVLSGDIGGDDETDGNGVVTSVTNINGDNAIHVVTADGTTGLPIKENTVLDGFTITAGQADGGSTDVSGGGFYCDGSGDGSVCSPRLSNVIFSANSAKSHSGAMCNDGSNNGKSSPILRDVTFVSNAAEEIGGAMTNDGKNSGDSNPRLTNVYFSGNSANYGGAVFNDGQYGTSSPTLINVTFSGNSAIIGGAMLNAGENGDCFPSLTNVTFSGNAAQYGGAIYNDGCLPDVRNSILWNNEDNSGTGTISATIYNDNATVSLTHSLVQNSMPGGSWIGGSYVDGGNNIDTDPMFVTPVDPSKAPTTGGNLRLKSGSPAIDAGKNTHIPGISTDLDNLPRITDGDGDLVETVDMGAYEYPSFYQYEVFGPLIFR
jgi:hypothetical protein